MPAGLKEQIDDLDQLLDQLLKLPIDQAGSAPATLPLHPKMKAGTEKPSTVLKLADEEAEAILSFEREDTISHPSQAESSEKIEITSSQDETVSVPEQPQQHAVEIHEQSVSALPEKQEKVETVVPPLEEIPWIEDEPVPGGKNKGPKVEIIVGPSSQVVAAPVHKEARQPVSTSPRRSWLFWLFWAWTWCFDQTLGYWFPWLRRPSVKFLLGLIGVALISVSIYLVWIGWLK